MGLDQLCIFTQACNASTNGFCQDQETEDHNHARRKAIATQYLLLEKLQKTTYGKNQRANCNLHLLTSFAFSWKTTTSCARWLLATLIYLKYSCVLFSVY